MVCGLFYKKRTEHGGLSPAPRPGPTGRNEPPLLTRRRHSQINQRLAQLTPREHEIMEMLVSGKPNKAIADLLGVSVRTVETHRANIMAKMQADSLSDLVRMMLDFKGEIRDN